MGSELLRLVPGAGSELPLDGPHQTRICRIREGSITIAATVYGRDIDDAIDLARLLRAAPNLLAACKALIGPDSYEEAHRLAMAAIELADGDS